jgi:hypothetical protein
MQDIPHDQLELLKVINDPNQRGAAGNNGYVVLYSYRNEVQRQHVRVLMRKESGGQVLHQIGAI